MEADIAFLALRAATSTNLGSTTAPLRNRDKSLFRETDPAFLTSGNTFLVSRWHSREPKTNSLIVHQPPHVGLSNNTTLNLKFNQTAEPDKGGGFITNPCYKIIKLDYFLGPNSGERSWKLQGFVKQLCDATPRQCPSSPVPTSPPCPDDINSHIKLEGTDNEVLEQVFPGPISDLSDEEDKKDNSFGSDSESQE